MRKRSILILSAALLSGFLFHTALRAGDPGGDLAKQQPKYHIKEIPPAPILTPEQEQKTFRLPPGFHIELVASEPMVEEPIALTWDPDGRMYVVELRAYMHDLNGAGELDPTGRIVRLESTAGDGRYDKVTTFLDGLIIPRAVGLAGDGVIVAEPPTVWFCRDTKGDGKCDEKKVIFTDYGQRNPNPEHMANGLVWTLDNWYYNANWPARFRYSKGQFLRDAAPSDGQWGIAQDDTGRLFYNTNSSFLRCDLVPAQYMTRNPYISSPAGLNVAVGNNATFPSRVNPGVNRGYTDDLNLEGKLQRVTASCGPSIYRANQFPAEYQGNAFVCEPAGNLVSRFQITEDGVSVRGKSIQHDGIDFLTSTDERFRPVNTYTGPDGALYVIDLYHGILQHKAYLSAYLADQVKKRDLEDNGGHRGRIWRITHDSSKPAPQPRLAKAPVAELVASLANPIGWWRDTAQRLLVERADKASVPLLRAVIAGKSTDVTPLAKIHALWALSGMEKLEDDDSAAAAKDPDPRVRIAAIRASELLVRKHTGPLTTQAIIALAQDKNTAVQFQVLAMSSPDLPEIQAAGTAILANHLTDPLFRGVAINAATGRELELLQALTTDKIFAAASAGKREFLVDLAECIVRSRSGDRLEKLLDLIAAQPASGKASQEALMAGAAEALAPAGKAKAALRHVRLLREPPALAALLKSPDKKISDLAAQAADVMSWPGKPGDTTPPLQPLSADQEKRYAVGKELFGQICAACHQPTGLGQDGVAPPLVDSEWVLGPQDRVARIVLNGLHGPLKVGKKTLDLEMPGLRALEDEQISGILTYVRREWGHEAAPIEPALVGKVRKETETRGDTQWTAEELLQIK